MANDFKRLSNILPEYKRCKIYNNNVVIAENEKECIIKVKKYDAHSGEIKEKTLGTFDIQSINDLISEKEKEIAELEEMKSLMTSKIDEIITKEPSGGSINNKGGI